MADGVAITAGSGTVVLTDDCGASGHAQGMKLAVSANGDATLIPATAAQGLTVDVTRVQGSVTVVSAVPGNLKVDASGVAVPVTDNSGSLTVDAPATVPLGVRLSDGAGFIAAALEHVTAASPHAVRLSDGSAFYAAPVAAQLPAALVGGRLDVVVGAALPAGAAIIGQVRLTDGTDIALVSAAGALLVDSSATTQPVSGSVTALQGTAAAASGAWPIKISDGSDTVGISTVSAFKALKVDVIQSVGVAGQADKSAFVEGTGVVMPAAGVFNETISGDPAEDQAAALRITAKRGLHVCLRNTAGAETGTDSVPLRTSPASGAAVQPTLDTNSAAIKTSVELIDDAIVTSAAAIGSAKGIMLAGNDGANVRRVKVSTAGELHVLLVSQIQTRVTTQEALIASQTGNTLWDPTTSTKFVITSLHFRATGAGDLVLFDETNSAANIIWKGTVTSTERIDIVFAVPWKSATADNILKYTSGSGLTGELTIHGYEE